MNSPFRNTWELYTGRFERILLLMLLTTLPLLILHSFATNYIYAVTPSFDPLYSFADIYYGFLTVLLFIYAQVPYIRFVYNEHYDSERSLRDSIYQFVVNGFTIFVFATLIAFTSIVGFSLFILPGFILLALTMPIPYISIFDKKSVWKAYKEGIRIGKKHFIKLFLLLIFTGFLEMIVGVFITAQIFTITNSFAAQIITQIVLNLIYYPFIIMLLSSFMIKWREEQEVLETREDTEVA
ncbi:hypothetical protein [Ornithinibacillus xuwenensis]|uniref:Uncharacterized protein n=1 Tax=Ornithinibacillus xuwenensis TaxID=3144668 RepID=A0ABU9XGY9_9BACI